MSSTISPSSTSGKRLGPGHADLRAPGPRAVWMWRALAGVLVIATMPVMVRGQEDADSGEEHRDPLAMKQVMIRDRFERFEDRIFRLQEQLEKTEPENARRLARVLERAGELGLQERLELIASLLEDTSSLNNAIEEQGEWIDQADQLLAILLERDSGNEERKREIDRLEEFKKDVDRLLQQERELRDASGEAGSSQGMLRQLDQAIQRLDALISKQAGLSAKSGQASPGSPEAGEAGKEQADLSRDTKQLAEDVDRLAELQPEAIPDSEAAKSAQSQTQAAAQSLQAGSKAMSQAAQSMQQGQAGGNEQAKAEQALQEAKEQLEKAKEALQEQHSSEELAEKQKQVAEETGELAQKMQQGSQGGQQGQQGGQQGQQGSQSGSQQSPGQQNVQQAQQNMQRAGDSLQQDAPQEALPEQDQAIEKLEQAKEELQKALEDLRKEERAEALRDLEQRFREMLSKQRGINEATVQLSDKGEENFGRPEHLQLADLSSDERALSQEAATCLHILEEDATTIVFPSVLEQIAVDMATVAKRLAELNVGLLTQRIEQQIVETLEQLLEAVQQMQQENEQQGMQAGQSGDQEQPLLPPSAELKLLRATQIRINQRTDLISRAAEERFESDHTTAEALATLAKRQKECAELATEIRDRKQMP